MLLCGLADVALRMLDLQVALAASSTLALVLWPTVYLAIADALAQFAALAELREWEPPYIQAALNCQATRRKEASKVARTLQQQIQAAIEHLKL